MRSARLPARATPGLLQQMCCKRHYLVKKILLASQRVLHLDDTSVVTKGIMSPLSYAINQ